MRRSHLALIALGILAIPIAVRATEEYLQSVPKALREGSLALGATKWRTIANIVIPAASRGIASGMLLALARIAGETAPLLFTSLNNQFWGLGFNRPTPTLPVMIFLYATGPYEEWHRQAWAAGFILLFFVLAINFVARFVLAKRASA